jgi:transcriptional regulator with XRE-family HTH domain
MSATFGERLRTLRLGKGLTQKHLAVYFKLSESTIGMYERGEREPSFQLIKAFASYFEVSIDYLLGITDVPSSSQTIREPFAAYLYEGQLDPETERFLTEYLRAPRQKREELQQIWEIIKQRPEKDE